MMLGGVGFQAGLDEAWAKKAQEQRQAALRAQAAAAPDVVEQLKGLKALRDAGALTPEEFQLAKRQVLGS